MDEVRTTTEIDTEVKLEIKLETESVIKVPTKISRGGARDQERIRSTSNSLQDAMTNGQVMMEEEGEEVKPEKTREEIKAEREAKKLAKQLAKKSKANVGGQLETPSEIPKNSTNSKVVVVVESNEKKKVSNTTNTLTKAERRAIQEAQRAAKAANKIQIEKQKQNEKDKEKEKEKKKTEKKETANKENEAPCSVKSSGIIQQLQPESTIKLFSHLERSNPEVNLFVNNASIHPSVARLGEQYARRTVVGSNARCIGFLNAMKMLIKDYETPAKKDFCRSLESSINDCVDYLQQCRPLAVSVNNAQKNLKQVLMHLNSDRPETELKEKLCNFIDTYVENQIGKAAQAINSMMQKKINDGDVLLTFGCSSLINYILLDALNRQVDFRVIVVDARPFSEGEELLRRLSTKGIRCSYVLINAVSFVMPEVTKVLLGAHALLANGYVMSRAGTAQVALVAHSFNVPVLVCCETHKFSERFQTDAIVYNELGHCENDSVVSSSSSTSSSNGWKSKIINPLILNYDVTPPELVTAVVTEVSVLPCTSVPVILRMKPDWITYVN